MSIPHLLLDDQMNAGSWGDSLKLLISLLAMVIVAIGVIVWWLRRG
jgi:uncharacterized iron-regulated membrane protein